jgi:hypothetical protein
MKNFNLFGQNINLIIVSRVKNPSVKKSIARKVSEYVV